MKTKKTASDTDNEKKAFKNLEALIKGLHAETSSSRRSVYGRRLFYRPNKFGEFGLNQQQKEIYFSIMDALAPDHGKAAFVSKSHTDTVFSSQTMRKKYFTKLDPLVFAGGLVNRQPAFGSIKNYRGRRFEKLRLLLALINGRCVVENWVPEV